MSATPSATALTLSSPAVLYGDEQDEQFTATVTGDGGTPTGTVTVSAGATTVCTIALVGGTGSCAPTAEQIPVGTVTLSAAYSGDDTFDPSSSSAVIQITSPPPPAVAATTTTLGLSATSVSYGHEQAEKISVTVAVLGGGGPNPVGTVTVLSGATKVCQLSLSSFGTGSCALGAAELPPGSAHLTASYAGNADFGSSASAAEPLAVAKEPTTTTVSLTATKVTYGAEQRERISVAVKPAFGVPAGRVTVKAGSAVICVVTLRSAKGTCSPGPARLAAGRHQITAVYGGSGDVASSASPARTLSVAVASSATTLFLSAGTVTDGSEGSEKISVKVTPRYAGTPGGTVTVKANGTTLAVIRLKTGMGSYTLSANRLPAGDYSLAATYGGNADFGHSASGQRSLTVASPPPPPAACYPLSSKGTCYEPGEYCSDADHGLTGIAGDGEAIICEDNDGWRWEPLG